MIAKYESVISISELVASISLIIKNKMHLNKQKIWADFYEKNDLIRRTFKLVSVDLQSTRLLFHSKYKYTCFLSTLFQASHSLLKTKGFKFDPMKEYKSAINLVLSEANVSRFLSLFECYWKSWKSWKKGGFSKKGWKSWKNYTNSTAEAGKAGKKIITLNVFIA